MLARASLLALAAPLLTVLLAQAIGIEVPPGHEGHRHVHLADERRAGVGRSGGVFR